VYSVLPGVVSLIFLSYGFYVVNQKGINRVSTSFLVLCVTTFFWQFAWAILFQVEDADTANFLIRMGWLLILFLPTSLYHFLTETSDYKSELVWVYTSYCFAAALSLLLLFTPLIIDGYHEYFFGFYPKAGSLHFLHVLQTLVVVNRALYITYRKQAVVKAGERSKLRYCTVGILIYFFAAIDYACNYGYEIYPPGVFFITVALAIFAVSTVKYHLMDGAMLIATSITHELRTPLATIKLQAKLLSSYMPLLLQSHEIARANRMVEPLLEDGELKMLKNIADRIEDEAKSANHSIDMLLAIVGDEDARKTDFKAFWVKDCVEHAVKNYPYKSEKEKIVRVESTHDFEIFASDYFLIYVLNNLISNALYAVKEKGSGEVEIFVDSPYIHVVDTGTGILPEIIAHVFDNFFTTKNRAQNTGVGLAFCKQTMTAFGGSISCQSIPDEGTTFTLQFKQST